MNDTNFHEAKIFVQNMRNKNEESISGVGSHLSNTKVTIDFINRAIKNYRISSILDLGCGDWNWFRFIDLSKTYYTGWDACEELVKNNNLQYSSSNVLFHNKDIVVDPFDKVDMVICRDVLFHMPINISTQVLDKIKCSTNYLIVSNFNEERKNIGIPENKKWGFYKINVNIPPFCLNEFLLQSELEQKHWSRYINIYAFNS